MHHIYPIFALALCSVLGCQTMSHTSNSTPQSVLPPIAIALHGGASNIRNLNLTPEQEAAYLNTLSAALDSGYAVLQRGGASIDACTLVVQMLEDSPLFNAGKGSVISNDGSIQMDAAVMTGQALHCGAVAGVRHIKNPVLAARAVMEHSDFVLLSEEGAEDFARQNGVEMVDTAYFYTPFRVQQWEKARHSKKTSLDNDSRGAVDPVDELEHEKFGTVGCVALDRAGNLAAATSTGGLVNKKYHRIGDSPLIGAGTYADNRSCAISCTGKGEDFIRFSVAHEVSSLMRYKDFSVKKAAKTILNEVKAYGGRGGCVAVDRNGVVAMRFTTSGMFRAKIDGQGRRKVAIFKTQH